MMTFNESAKFEAELLENVEFSDLFEVEELQKLQDLFSDAHGVASIITHTNGVPITAPSNFRKLCVDIIRKTERGCANCFKSDAAIGRHNPDGPIVQPCLSGGLWDAGASITVGGKHIANWLIGQVRTAEQDNTSMAHYASEIGTNRDEFLEALEEVPVMPIEQFRKIAGILFAFANQLSEKAFSNYKLKIEIAERKKAAKQIKESSELLSLTLQSIGDGVITTGKDGQITMMNPTAERLTGWSFAEARGLPFDQVFNIVNVNTRLKVDNTIERVLKTGEVSGIEKHTILLNRNNAEYHISDSAAPIKDHQGNIHGAILVFSDITPRYEIEKSLSDSENFLKDTQTIARLGTYYLDIPAGAWKSSEILDEIFGIGTGFIRSIEGWITILHPDYKEYMADYFLKEVIGRKQNFNKEYKIIRQTDKAERWVHGRGELKYNTAGEPIAMIGTIHDITERVHAEEKLRMNEEMLRTLFASMTEMVALHEMVFDENGTPVNYRIIECNASYLKVTGTKREDVIGKLATEVYQTELPPYMEEFGKVAATGVPYEYTTYFQPMDKHFMISVISPQKNKFATITTDITAIQQIQDLISEKNKELENYLYVASHDLRSPLVNIQGFSQRLQKQINLLNSNLSTISIPQETKISIDNILQESLPKTLGFIYSNVQKMDVLINGLLQISRTGRLKMNIREVNMNELIKNVITTLNYELTEISANVIINDLPACFGDEHQLNQLFSNITDNAIKYRDLNRPFRLEISGKSNYSKVIFRVHDNGIGIPARHLDRIWDVFYRVDSGAPQSGEGLGLSVAKRIVDKHRGRIWATSEEGVGTIFFIELPAKMFSE